MNSQELKDICKINSRCNYILKGVYPVDKVPHNLSYPCFLIVNSDEHYLPGTHWIGIYIDNYRRAIFLDSFALDPEYYGLKNYIMKMSESFTTLKIPLQNISSNVCGLYQLYFLFYIANNTDTSNFVSAFTQYDTCYNDNLVKYLVSKYIKEGSDK